MTPISTIFIRCREDLLLWQCFLSAIVLIGCAGSTEIQKTESYVDVRQAPIYVKTMGEGEPLLFVHGGPGLDHSYFLPHLQELAQAYTLIFYDQRASGRSGIGDTVAFSMDQFVADLDAVRAHAGFDQVHLVGHSWGGYLSMRYALAHPERLRSLILMNSNAASSSIQQTAATRVQERFTPQDLEERVALLQSDGFANRTPEALNTFYRISFRPSFAKPALVDSLSFYIDPGFQEKSAALQRLGADSTVVTYDLHASLTGLNVPALIIHATHDLLTIEDIMPIHQALPESKLQIIEDSGHFPFIEQPELLLLHLKSFLQHRTRQNP